MRHTALYPAILVTAFLMMVVVSGLATTPKLYRQMAVAQNDSLAPDDTNAMPAQDDSARAINLQAVSTLTLLGTSLNLILPGPRQPMAMIGPGDDSRRLFDPATPSLCGSLRGVFLQWLLACAAVFGLIIWLMRRFLERHYSAPLTALIDTINEFSENPAVAIPIPDPVTSSPEFLAAAGALDSLQRNTLIALRQRERLADVGEAMAKVNPDMRNVLSSATLVADTLIASEDPRVRRAAYRALAGTVGHSLPINDGLSCRNTGSRTGHHHDARPCRRNSTDSGIKVDYSGPGHLYLDRTMMARILLNLARNAAAARAAKVSIDIWRGGRLDVVDIADDGPGIPRGQWEDLFLAFRSRRHGGTGLGLAIARDLVVAQGGNLKMTRSTDDGSEFRLQLPVEMFSDPTSADEPFGGSIADRADGSNGGASVATADNRR